ncbi:MAG: penicillin-binding protein activator LpoB [Treponema sp.]|jgi:uncharacterized protein (TIGR02722 family)|nr:penicillin-binding protein activator LpoB [Treponema sp.]
MHKIKVLWICGILAALVSCGHTVKRVDSNTRTDLSGYWNDTDLRLASSALIKACLDSPRLTQFSAAQGRLPVLIVGPFKNTSDEHIDTAILAGSLETAISNSGRADFVASGDLRNALRAERLDQQQGYTSDATIAALGREQGADFMLSGEVRTMVDRYEKTATRSYFITARLTSITTNVQIWTGKYDEIKKVIRNPSVKP